jgi:LuxR family maltose regulon positive regulatory protein
MCGPLCDEVLGDIKAPGKSQEFLDALERANMFIIPLDNQRQWYRYHHLFSELLQHTLNKNPNMQNTELHKRASHWFEKHGFLQEAVQHAFKTEDWIFASELIERHAMDLIAKSQVDLLEGWFGAMPENIIQSRPGLSIFKAWNLMLTFRADYRDAVADKIRQAEEALNDPSLPIDARVGQGGTLVPLREWVIGQACGLRSQLLLAAFNEPIDPQELIHYGLRVLNCYLRSKKPFAQFAPLILPLPTSC